MLALFFSNPKRYKKNGFSDPAAVPFFEVRKFIADRKPKLLILENVKGLLAPNPETPLGAGDLEK